MSTAPAPARECKQRGDLDRALQMALADYKRGVNILDWARGQMKRNQHECLQKYIEEARLRSEEGRQALDRHVQKHGC